MSDAIESATVAVAVAVTEVEKKVEEVKETVLKSVGDVSGALLSLVESVGAEIKDIPEVASLLKYVPRFISVVQTLTVPGSEKKTLVLSALHALVHLLVEEHKVLKAELKAEADRFIDTVIPVSIDTTMDIVKGRITVASVAQTLASNPQAVATVVETSVRCCSALFCRGAKKTSLDSAAAALTTTLQTAAVVTASVTASGEKTSEPEAKTEAV
jgi:hypothetical protein